MREPTRPDPMEEAGLGVEDLSAAHLDPAYRQAMEDRRSPNAIVWVLVALLVVLFICAPAACMLSGYVQQQKAGAK